MCTHQPTCPVAEDPDRDAARIVCAQPAQGWSLLCNGVVVFDDTGELMPDGVALAPRGLPLELARRRFERSAPAPVALAG
jgi:hypothetical protein